MSYPEPISPPPMPAPSPSGPIHPPWENPPNQPKPPPGAPGGWIVAAVTVALFLTASAADAATGGGAMPYSSWLTTFRTSVTGEIPLIISLIAIVCGVGGWIAGGDLSGMMMYLMKAVCGSAIILGATVLVANLGVGGATIPMDAETASWLISVGAL